jgi:putative CocE/NonD family hydrolase
MKYSLLLFVLVLTSIVGFAQPSDGPSRKPAEDVYDIQSNVLIQTRSAASLAATVVTRKQSSAPLPAILFYTTYDQGERDTNFGKRAVDNGYVGVVAYARGVRTNLNNYAPYEHESNDIYDLIDWISKQSWCNSKVGMYGGSYTGFSQWATMKRIHPALKTIVPQVAVMPGYDTPMENAVCPSALCLRWSNDILKFEPLPQDVYNKWYEKGSAYRSLDTLAGRPNRIFQKWLQHPDYDAYWKSLIPTASEFARINIPILSTTGYYDPAQLGALRYVKLHYKYNRHANHYFVIGPYDHFGGQRNFSATLMGYDIDPVAKINMQDLAYQWFDYILKSGNKPELLKDKINYEVMGANEWLHTSSLEKISNRTLTLYLTGSAAGTNYRLSPEKPKKLNFLTEKVDFKDRNTQNNFYMSTIINDSFDPGEALVFSTGVFDKPFSINGSFSGQLSAAINKRDMDISAIFFELLPDGKYFYLTRYLGRASYAKDLSRRMLLRPGAKTLIPIADTRMVSKQIGKGSRLVVAIHINKNPFEVINYGSGKNVYDETIDDAKEPLLVKWYNDSYIKVPISD